MRRTEVGGLPASAAGTDQRVDCRRPTRRGTPHGHGKQGSGNGKIDSKKAQVFVTMQSCDLVCGSFFAEKIHRAIMGLFAPSAVALAGVVPAGFFCRYWGCDFCSIPCLVLFVG